MPKSISYTEHTIWRVVDGHWTNILCEYIQGKAVRRLDLFKDCLADYLWSYLFDIPECITYCLAENSKFKLKFRRLGGSIHIFINRQT